MKKLLTLFFLCGFYAEIFAEPYLAVREGFHCSSCHVNPTGGGMRNEFGYIFGANNLAAKVAINKNIESWTGQLGGPVRIGANGRYSSRQFEIDDIDTNNNLGVDRTSLYLSADLNETVSVMIDQQLSPGGSQNRESWVRLSFDQWYVKAGKIFQPFGWRLEDDTAFVRQATGINFTNGDNGIEVGFEKGSWSTQLAVTNGTGGSNEVDDGKQTSFRLAQVLNNMQWGVSANLNNTDSGDRTIAGIFFGVKTGAVTWLGEWDRIEDSGFVFGDMEQDLALLEANYLIAKGHNLKFTLESQQFSIGIADRQRYSIVYEYFPVSFSQLRFGARENNSDEVNAFLNSQELFAQVHIYF